MWAFRANTSCYLGGYRMPVDRGLLIALRSPWLRRPTGQPHAGMRSWWIRGPLSLARHTRAGGLVRSRCWLQGDAVAQRLRRV